MARDIRPLTSNDVPELSEFLTAGFHTPPGADYAAPDVLRWKYLEPIEPRNAETDTEAGVSTAPRSYLARGETGAIIGHLGLCRTAFEGRALANHGGRIATIHIIDWLGSSDHRAVGTSLMRKAHEGVPTQFGLGVSQAALVVGERIGYELRSLVPVYTRALRGVLDADERVEFRVALLADGTGYREPLDSAPRCPARDDPTEAHRLVRAGN